jgi:hypothetical protein
MRHASRLRTTFVGVVLGIALLSLAQAHAQNWDTDKPATDTAANVFAPTVRADRSGMSQREWLDVTPLLACLALSGPIRTGVVLTPLTSAPSA